MRIHRNTHILSHTQSGIFYEVSYFVCIPLDRTTDSAASQTISLKLCKENGKRQKLLIILPGGILKIQQYLWLLKSFHTARSLVLRAPEIAQKPGYPAHRLKIYTELSSQKCEEEFFFFISHLSKSKGLHTVHTSYTHDHAWHLALFTNYR